MTSQHWESVYGSKAHDEVSWFQEDPSVSRALIRRFVPSGGSVVDIGAGASLLADRLVDDAFRVTLLDVSAAALDVTRARLGERASLVSFVRADVLDWLPPEEFDAWHDRAVFHFLVSDDDRHRYVRAVTAALRPGGVVVMGTFALDGPTQCSGLPVRRYDQSLLAAEFGDRFALEHHERERHRTPWDAEQPFTWAVLRRTA